MSRIIKNHNKNCNLQFITETQKRYSKIDWSKLEEFFHYFDPVLFDTNTLETMERYVFGEKLKILDIKMSVSSNDYTTQKLLEREYMKIHQDFVILWRDYQEHQKTQKYFQLYIHMSNFCEKV